MEPLPHFRLLRPACVADAVAASAASPSARFLAGGTDLNRRSVGSFFVNPVLDLWASLPARDFPNYAAGTRGPAAADELLRRHGRSWVDLP